MLFSNFVKSESGNLVILKNSVPIENIGNIRFFKDDSHGTFDKKEFRWSFNNSYWSAWAALNQGNLSGLELKGNKLFLEIRYVKANQAANVSTFSITFDQTSPSSTQQQQQQSSPTFTTTPSSTPTPKSSGNTQVFSNFSKTDEGNITILRNISPIQNVEKIRFYKDDSSGSFDKKEFRWSNNRGYWSSWESLNQGNLSNLNLKKSLLFFEFRYVKANLQAKISKISITYEQYDAASVVQDTTCTPSSPITPTKPCPQEYYQESCATTTSKDCTTLDGQPGSYYLWRPNHKGQQPINTITGLQQILDGKQAVGNYIKESSLGTDFVWSPAGLLDVSIITMDYAY